MPKSQLVFALSLLAIAGCAGPQTRPAQAPAASTLPAPDGEVSAQDRELVRSLEGEWRLTEADAEAKIDAAIAAVTQQMGSFIGGIASGRIDEAVDADERLRVEAAGDAVLFALGDGVPLRLPLNGPAVSTTNDAGETVRTRAMVEGERLLIEEQTPQGARILIFEPRGDALELTTRIRSERLPEDIVYGLRYERGEVAQR